MSEGGRPNYRSEADIRKALALIPDHPNTAARCALLMTGA